MRENRLKPYHRVWLACHPGRTAEWLLERLADGFHVHHADGNHSNDAPSNLMLIEGLDHMLIVHGHKVAGIFTTERARKMGKKRWEHIPEEKRKKMMQRLAKTGWVARRRARRERERAGI